MGQTSTLILSFGGGGAVLWDACSIEASCRCCVEAEAGVGGPGTRRMSFLLFPPAGESLPARWAPVVDTVTPRSSRVVRVRLGGRMGGGDVLPGTTTLPNPKRRPMWRCRRSSSAAMSSQIRASPYSSSTGLAPQTALSHAVRWGSTAAPQRVKPQTAHWSCLLLKLLCDPDPTGSGTGFGYIFPCDGLGRGGACDISAWDAFYLCFLNVCFWMSKAFDLPH